MTRPLLRLSASTVVETDMAEFEGALNERWCHLKGRPCGASSNPGGVGTHKGWANDSVGFASDGRCAGCSRRPCPDCLAIWSARNA